MGRKEVVVVMVVSMGLPGYRVGRAGVEESYV